MFYAVIIFYILYTLAASAIKTTCVVFAVQKEWAESKRLRRNGIFAEIYESQVFMHCCSVCVNFVTSQRGDHLHSTGHRLKWNWSYK